MHLFKPQVILKTASLNRITMNSVTLLVRTSRRRLQDSAGLRYVPYGTTDVECTENFLGNKIICKGLWVSRSVMDHPIACFWNLQKTRVP